MDWRTDGMDGRTDEMDERMDGRTNGQTYRHTAIRTDPDNQLEIQMSDAGGQIGGHWETDQQTPLQFLACWFEIASVATWWTKQKCSAARNIDSSTDSRFWSRSQLSPRQCELYEGGLFVYLSRITTYRSHHNSIVFFHKKNKCACISLTSCNVKISKWQEVTLSVYNTFFHKAKILIDHSHKVPI